MISCRMCQSHELIEFLDLGFTPPADQFKRKDQLKEAELYYPLRVCLCQSCSLVQLDHVVSPEVLYRNDYPYESSMTKTGQEHWNKFAKSTVANLGISQNSLVVDIGSNVGVLLDSFKNLGMRVCGIDPAANIVLLARERGIDTVCDFLNQDSVAQILSKHGNAAVITATNVFAHVDDLRSFMQNILKILTPDGVFIFEAPYFKNLINLLEYDTIYHEHLSYLSVKPLVPFLKAFGLEIFDITLSDIHGGSFRVFLNRVGQRPVKPIVSEMIKDEIDSGLYSIARLKEFKIAVENNRRELVDLLHSLKRAGKRIAGVSAPAKGMTLLNYCRIGPELLDFVTEKSTLKIGRFTPGTHIPVVGDDELLVKKPDFALVLAWNFGREIMENLSQFKCQGGKFILPLPRPRAVD